MKCRFTNNSIRFRLRKSDLNSLLEKGKVQTQLNVSFNQCLTFTLKMHEDLKAPYDVQFVSGDLILSIAKEIVQPWSLTDSLTLHHSLSVKDNEVLDILVEKDLPCKDRPDEDKSDTFQELEDKSLNC